MVIHSCRAVAFTIVNVYVESVTRTQIVINEDLLRRAKERAKRLDMSFSEVVRQALRELLEQASEQTIDTTWMGSLQAYGKGKGKGKSHQPADIAASVARGLARTVHR